MASSTRSSVWKPSGSSSCHQGEAAEPAPGGGCSGDEGGGGEGGGGEGGGGSDGGGSEGGSAHTLGSHSKN